MARVYRLLQAEGLGLNLLVHCLDLDTVVAIAGALARECGLKLRICYYHLVAERDSNSKVRDPLNQKMLYPMDYIFSRHAGEAAMTLLLDLEGSAFTYQNDEENRERSPETNRCKLDAYLRLHLFAHRGLFCLWTPGPLQGALPVEFSFYFDLEYPAEEEQIQTWKNQLKELEISENDLATLVKECPLHVGEIGYLASRARIESIVRGYSGENVLELLRTITIRFRGKRNTPTLFGLPTMETPTMESSAPRYRLTKVSAKNKEADALIPF
jgi:hypothetical protein